MMARGNPTYLHQKERILQQCSHKTKMKCLFLFLFWHHQIKQVNCSFNCGACHVKFCVEHNTFMAPFLIFLVTPSLAWVVNFHLQQTGSDIHQHSYLDGHRRNIFLYDIWLIFEVNLEVVQLVGNLNALFLAIDSPRPIIRVFFCNILNAEYNREDHCSVEPNEINIAGKTLISLACIKRNGCVSIISMRKEACRCGHNYFGITRC